MDMAKNLLRTGGNAIKAYVNGNPVFSSTQMVIERTAICRACPSGKYIREKDRCASCGCYIRKSIGGLPGKATIASAECPEGHW